MRYTSARTISVTATTIAAPATTHSSRRKAASSVRSGFRTGRFAQST
jgi:hypothetical protein